MSGLMQNSTVSEETYIALSEIDARVRALSELYNLLYVSDSVIETHLDVYFSRILASLPFEENIQVETSLASLKIPVKIAISLGLILTELMTNIYRHAFPHSRTGVVRVSLRIDGDNGSIEVVDNGVGLPENFNPAQSSTLGMVMILALSRQIRGEYSFESQPQQGTRFMLRFPLRWASTG